MRRAATAVLLVSATLAAWGVASADESPVTTTSGPPAAEPTPTPRPEDKTLVAALDVEQGDGKDRVSLYRDGTLVLVRTYLGVRTVKKRVLSEVEVDVVRRVAAEALRIEVPEYRIDVLGATKPRRFRIEVGREGDLPKVFVVDELARVPLALGRTRGALEELLARFDESAGAHWQKWDPARVKAGDVLVRRDDGQKYRVVRDDTFVRSLELLEAARGLQRLVVLREELPRMFLPPEGADGSEELPR
ncbi:MAG: hypothetical protein KBB14_13275 [Thermoanaerobaculia bacterium]|nr:hypothetical protein [Thermoanaerobaculia bacterium]